MPGHGGTRRSKPMGMVGKALENDRRRQAKQQDVAQAKMTGVTEKQAGRSVLEQSSLDDFLAAADLGQAKFDAVRGEHMKPVDCSARIVSAATHSREGVVEQERVAAARRVRVPIPRRPAWYEGMSADELAGAEGEAFLSWRRDLAKIEEIEGLVMTPYEKNLDFWRQLWRCIERSDLLVQILDARDPEFYRCHDLERYVETWPAKKHLLLVNKADFLTPELRQQWKSYFASAGVDVLFFSALRELHRMQRLPCAVDEKTQEDQPVLPPHGPLCCDDDEVADCAKLMEELCARTSASSPDAVEGDSKRGVVGFVGYPNVGKSSVINALFGAKKVSMSRTPGKTKHLQTLELPDFGLTLCDCPGLVFPSVVASKAHLVINGTVPLTELRDALDPARIVVDKVGVSGLMQKYSISAGNLREAAIMGGDERAVDDSARSVLAAMALARHRFVGGRVPDEGWAARKLLYEYVTGEVLHCESPPGFSPPPRVKANATSATTTSQDTSEREVANVDAPTPVAVANAEESESDFSDLDDFLKESRGDHDKGMTKRKTRMMNKRTQKGGAVLAKQLVE